MEIHETLTREISAALTELEQLFKPEMELTFIARHPTNPGANIIVTNDSFEKILACIELVAAQVEDGSAIVVEKVSP